MVIKNEVAAQRVYFQSGATLSYESRVKALRLLKKTLLENEELIFASLERDLNKSRNESYMTELGMILDEITFTLKHLKKWMKAKKANVPITQFCSSGKIYSEPYGTVLIISAWNYPFELCFAPLIGAIAAGNCAVVKPAKKAQASAETIKKIISTAFSEEYIYCVDPFVCSNEELLKETYDYVFYTGSASIGKKIMSYCAETLTPLTLELGGKSPCIIDETANIPLSAKRVAFGKLLNAGQTCVAPDYILIHENVKDEFLSCFQKALETTIPNGEYLRLPKIVNKSAYDELIKLTDGEKVLLSFGQDDEANRLMALKLLGDITFDSPIMQREIFGPILPVITFSDMDKIIYTLKNRQKPLALYLFSDDLNIIEKIINNVSFGGGCINDTIMHLNTHMPFGGVGQSGMGSYHGKYSFDTFSHKKSVLRKYNFIDIKLRYRPYTQTQLSIIKKFLK